ncbi:MAG: Csu type fimbrial protein [Kluyvera sp.]
MNTSTKFIFLSLALAITPAAYAALATNTFQVQITIQSACSVAQPSPLIFPSSLASATNVQGTTTLNVTCSKTTPYNIGLAPSSGNGGTTTGSGAMAGTTGNTDKVPYQLNQDAAGTKPWGNTATASVVGNGVAGVGNGLPQSVTVHAVVASANFTPDNYSDTVTINVNY